MKHNTPDKPYRRGIERQRGVVSLEFVLILPVLLLLIFGTIEWGWALTKLGQVNYAAREGARVGARADATTAEIQATVDNRMTQSGLGNSGYTTSITQGTQPMTPVTVLITAPYRPGIELTGFPLIPVPESLRAEVTMSREGP